MFSTLEGYYDACGNIMSTLGDVQYIGGLPSGGYYDSCGDIMSTLWFSI